MAFRALFLAHAPDADKEKHRSIIDTGKYRLFTVAVRNQAEALEVCKELVEKEAIDQSCFVPGSHTGMWRGSRKQSAAVWGFA